MAWKTASELGNGEKAPSTVEEEEEEEEQSEAEKLEWWRRITKDECFRKTVGHLSMILGFLIYTCIGALIFQAIEYETEAHEKEAVRTKLLFDRSTFVDQILNMTEGRRPSNDQAYPPGLENWDGENDLSKRKELEERVSYHLRKYEKVVVESSGVRVTPLENGTVPGWSLPKSLFFTATVLTTIGYGNIAPITIEGKIFCIVFALVGIPLTLTIIADMGEVSASVVPVDKLTNVLPDGKLRHVVAVLATLGLLMGIIAIGGCLFALLQGWSFMDAFYFCFITTTTIGFGDLVPDVETWSWSLVCCTLYILVGPVFTSTVIELVRRQYASSWEQMKQLSLRLNTISGPLAEAMKRMAETGAGEVEVDANLVRELRDLDTAFTRVLKEEEGERVPYKPPEDDPWEALLNMAAKKKRITILMYESNV